MAFIRSVLQTDDAINACLKKLRNTYFSRLAILYIINTNEDLLSNPYCKRLKDKFWAINLLAK